MLRFELWNNAVTSPQNLSDADGQYMEMIHKPATTWSIAWHDPDIMECFCLHTFNSIAERKAHILEVTNAIMGRDIS